MCCLFLSRPAEIMCTPGFLSQVEVAEQLSTKRQELEDRCTTLMQAPTDEGCSAELQQVLAELYPLRRNRFAIMSNDSPRGKIFFKDYAVFKDTTLVCCNITHLPNWTT